MLGLSMWARGDMYSRYIPIRNIKNIDQLAYVDLRTKVKYVYMPNSSKSGRPSFCFLFISCLPRGI